MTPRFSVRTAPAFDRLARRLAGEHPEFLQLYAQAIGILVADPHNVGRRHNILKLKGVRPGDGAYRLRLGRFRFRYDIASREVELVYCGLRREDTYRRR
jgi:mRNA-degrading endonuclease RelE of RelBE toxin-antitoxin system